jgi:hypothetical protein
MVQWLQANKRFNSVKIVTDLEITQSTPSHRPHPHQPASSYTVRPTSQPPIPHAAAPISKPPGAILARHATPMPGKADMT